ncbi:ATPase regulatory factor involved in DnaA inactivation [Crenothrix polyspora]|uniref:ATPase regulatory factor involved in DnaA inactivation n=1 Tax=Crenothrix polyspora TaxID=360316 RepID=A0A1R4H6D8_9GAMM|nr:DnaA regulatory inactivator Hda [Crenothrix polyspora]SJM91812.1 ATPase regulatory factor involved in DnaA inactivation [Crenothrix polyspora]
MAQQIPLDFEFRANKTFADYFPAANQEVVSHLQRCVAGMGEQQIFLWGHAGQGKSHLLQACCHAMQQRGLRSFYYDLSPRNLNDIDLFTGLDDYDLVCLDNIEHIAGKSDWELAFFNFFNRQRDLVRKLILSASSPPTQINIRLPDLKTRINWGLTLKLQPFSDPDQIAALIFKADKMGFDLSTSAGHFLLTHYHRDLESLWTLLDTLDRASLIAKRKLTLPFLKQILNKKIDE